MYAFSERHPVFSTVFTALLVVATVVVLSRSRFTGPVSGTVTIVTFVDVDRDNDMTPFNNGHVPEDVWAYALAGAGDNCPQYYNPGQEDFDHDGVGDLCDEYPDGGSCLLEPDYCVVEPEVEPYCPELWVAYAPMTTSDPVLCPLGTSNPACYNMDTDGVPGDELSY